VREKERDALVDSRYVNARFQMLGRSICVAVECECVSRSIPDGKGGVSEDAPREAWPRALSHFGASWVSCLDGGFAVIASNPSLVLRPDQYRPIPSRVKT